MSLFFTLLGISAVFGKSTFRFPGDGGRGLVFPEETSTQSYRVSYGIINSRSGAGRVLFPENGDNEIHLPNSKSVSDGKHISGAKDSYLPTKVHTHAQQEDRHIDTHSDYRSTHTQPEVNYGGFTPLVQPQYESALHVVDAPTHYDENEEINVAPHEILEVADFYENVYGDNQSFENHDPNKVHGPNQIYGPNQNHGPNRIQDSNQIQSPSQIYGPGQFRGPNPNPLTDIQDETRVIPGAFGSVDHLSVQGEGRDSEVVEAARVIPNLQSESHTDDRNEQINPSPDGILKKDFLNGTAVTTVQVSQGKEDVFPNFPIFDGSFPPPLISNHYIPPNNLPWPVDQGRTIESNNQYFDPTITIQGSNPGAGLLNHFGHQLPTEPVNPVKSVVPGVEVLGNPEIKVAPEKLIAPHMDNRQPVIIHVTVVNNNPEPKVTVVNNNPERLHLIQEVKVVEFTTNDRAPSGPKEGPRKGYLKETVKNPLLIPEPENPLLITESEATVRDRVTESTTRQPKVIKDEVSVDNQPAKFTRPVKIKRPKTQKPIVTTFKPQLSEAVRETIESQNEPRTSSVSLMVPFKEERVGNATLRIAASTCPKLFGNLTLNCDISPLGVNRNDMIFSWRRKSSGDKEGHTEVEEKVISNGNIVLIDDTRYQVTPTAFGSQLIISNITVDDCGTYVCEAFRARGTGERALIDFLIYLCL